MFTFFGVIGGTVIGFVVAAAIHNMAFTTAEQKVHKNGFISILCGLVAAMLIIMSFGSHYYKKNIDSDVVAERDRMSDAVSIYERNRTEMDKVVNVLTRKVTRMESEHADAIASLTNQITVAVLARDRAEFNLELLEKAQE